MGLEVEEAWGLLRQKGYTNQYEANWNVLFRRSGSSAAPSRCSSCPRAPTLPKPCRRTRPRKARRLRNQTAIDMLQAGDVAVVDLFGKIEGGTFVGDKLAYYVQKTTGTGLVVDGALFYLSRIQKTGMPAYYRGTHPGSLDQRHAHRRQRAGAHRRRDRHARRYRARRSRRHPVHPAAARRGSDRVGEDAAARDEWVKKKFDTGKYKSGEIYGRPTDPKLLKEMEEFIKQKTAKKPN